MTTPLEDLKQVNLPKHTFEHFMFYLMRCIRLYEKEFGEDTFPIIPNALLIESNLQLRKHVGKYEASEIVTWMEYNLSILNEMVQEFKKDNPYKD